jgi:hypothetical protein
MALVGFTRFEPAGTDEKGEPAGSGRNREPTLGLVARPDLKEAKALLGELA